LFSAHFGFLVAAVAAKAAWWFYSQKPSFGASSPSDLQLLSTRAIAAIKLPASQRSTRD
jgi:hypothetical protein